MEEYKYCSKCKETKLRTNEFFYNDKKSKDGFTHWCKSCIKESQEKNKEHRKEYLREYHKTHKKKPKPLSEEARARKNKRARERSQETPVEIKRAKQRAYAQTPNGKFSEKKNDARKRDLCFELTFEQFMEFWNVPCNYCGTEIETIGIDRIDNTLGYTYENCAPCCAICNRMKLCLTREEFLEHIKKICRNQEGSK